MTRCFIDKRDNRYIIIVDFTIFKQLKRSPHWKEVYGKESKDLGYRVTIKGKTKAYKFVNKIISMFMKAERECIRNVRNQDKLDKMKRRQK